jgi:hypothetical protein
MQDIDPLLILQPLVYLAMSVGLVLYWRLRRTFRGVVLVLAFAAYAGAIAMKEVFQALTLGAVTSAFGAVSVQTGLYFGLQTSVFEVGLAYLVARYAVSKRRVTGADAEAYGISLAFWENGVLLGALSLLSVSLTYVLIAQGLMPQSAYQQLVATDPSLFYPPGQLAVPVALGVLERASSLLFHLSWGYLCVLAAYLRRRAYLLAALPMGLVDATVPFAREVPLWEYEGALFALSLAAFLATWTITGADRRAGYVVPGAAPPSS